MPLNTRDYSVRFVEGNIQSNDRRFKGAQTKHGVALGTTSSRGDVTIYTTGGRYDAKYLEHEIAHLILFSHRVPTDQHHDIMRKAGYRW